MTWASIAATEHGVPEGLMRAISLVETARDDHGAGWPWTANINGRGAWFDTKAQAHDAVTRAISSGASQIDVGCFQLNLKWHSRAFGSLDEMLSPSANARYAARFLVALKDEFDSWEQAAAAFHSRTPALGQAYLARLRDVAAGREARSAPDRRVSGQPTGSTPARPGSLASLVPSSGSTGGRPFIALAPSGGPLPQADQ